MTTPVATALATILRIRGVAVTYVRGDDELELTAIPAATEFAEQSDTYDSTAWEGRDFLIEAAELASLDPRTPRRGDKITETIDGVTRTYDVLAPSGMKPFRFMGPRFEWLRVHTKLTGEAEA